MGRVRVFDAGGNDLAASLSVQPGATRIVVDGACSRPRRSIRSRSIPEIGNNDYRLSDMGLDGDLTYDGVFSSIAYDTISQSLPDRLGGR